MALRTWLKRRVWGRGRRVRFIFVHPSCGQADVEAGYLPEWGRPKFLCRRCGVAFDEARALLGWENQPGSPEGSRVQG